jgi:hypothetical protein
MRNYVEIRDDLYHNYPPAQHGRLVEYVNTIDVMDLEWLEIVLQFYIAQSDEIKARKLSSIKLDEFLNSFLLRMNREKSSQYQNVTEIMIAKKNKYIVNQLKFYDKRNLINWDKLRDMAFAQDDVFIYQDLYVGGEVYMATKKRFLTQLVLDAALAQNKPNIARFLLVNNVRFSVERCQFKSTPEEFFKFVGFDLKRGLKQCIDFAYGVMKEYMNNWEEMARFVKSKEWEARLRSQHSLMEPKQIDVQLVHSALIENKIEILHELLKDETIFFDSEASYPFEVPDKMRWFQKVLAGRSSKQAYEELKISMPLLGVALRYYSMYSEDRLGDAYEYNHLVKSLPPQEMEKNKNLWKSIILLLLNKNDIGKASLAFLSTVKQRSISRLMLDNAHFEIVSRLITKGAIIDLVSFIENKNASNAFIAKFQEQSVEPLVLKLLGYAVLQRTAMKHGFSFFSKDNSVSDSDRDQLNSFLERNTLESNNVQFAQHIYTLLRKSYAQDLSSENVWSQLCLALSRVYPEILPNPISEDEATDIESEVSQVSSINAVWDQNREKKASSVSMDNGSHILWKRSINKEMDGNKDDVELRPLNLTDNIIDYNNKDSIEMKMI